MWKAVHAYNPGDKLEATGPTLHDAVHNLEQAVDQEAANRGQHIPDDAAHIAVGRQHQHRAILELGGITIGYAVKKQ